MHPEALILRRCYPVPVTFADLRAAHALLPNQATMNAVWAKGGRVVGGADCQPASCWYAAIKQATGAIDEVYAVVDGREVRVAIVDMAAKMLSLREGSSIDRALNDLLIRADEQGYWERPHEVRLDLSPRPVSHGEVARAVLVGQEALERGGMVRS